MEIEVQQVLTGFKGCEVWLVAGYRNALGFDGYHLKGPHPGVL